VLHADVYKTAESLDILTAVWPRGDSLGKRRRCEKPTYLTAIVIYPKIVRVVCKCLLDCGNSTINVGLRQRGNGNGHRRLFPWNEIR